MRLGLEQFLQKCRARRPPDEHAVSPRHDRIDVAGRGNQGQPLSYDSDRAIFVFSVRWKSWQQKTSVAERFRLPFKVNYHLFSQGLSVGASTKSSVLHCSFV